MKKLTRIITAIEVPHKVADIYEPVVDFRPLRVAEFNKARADSEAII